MTDPRAIAIVKVPAPLLRPGDVVNTAPGAEDDWQQVTAVHTLDTPTSGPAGELLSSIGDRYVMVEMSDISPVDSNVYFADDGTALAFGSDGEDDLPVLDLVSDPALRRTYLYTVHELVTVRSAD